MAHNTSNRSGSNRSGEQDGGGERGNTAAVSARREEVSIERPALYVVATPIGNLGDLSPRAIAVLGGVDRVLCEDTRHSARLLEHYAINTPLSAYHDHSKAGTADALVDQLIADTAAFALISDAGTPLISDPGFRLVAAAHDRAVPVRAVPGPSALAAALSIAGLPTDAFLFAGFPPARAAARDARLRELSVAPHTVILFEAPHRIGRLLDAIAEICGPDRIVVVARELTKRFETLYRGDAGELAGRVTAETLPARGEFVVMIAPATPAEGDEEIERVLDATLPHTDNKTALAITVALTGGRKNDIYQRILERRESGH